MTLITGNTYPVKDSIKKLGGRWDPVAKGWMVPDDKASEARALVGTGGVRWALTPSAARSPFSARTPHRWTSSTVPPQRKPSGRRKSAAKPVKHK